MKKAIIKDLATHQS